jgi:hypothetical protein
MRGLVAVLAGRISLAAALVALPVVPACGRSAQPAPPHVAVVAQAAQPHVTGVAQPVLPDPDIGVVFVGDTSLHTCTGAVLRSEENNLILTAAHCLAAGIPITFVPGFSGVAVPGDTWKVDAVYLDPRWVTRQDPLADYAIARVVRDVGGRVESPNGLGLWLGQAPKAGTVVAVTGYGAGVGGSPVACQGSTAMNPVGYPSLLCPGLLDGTSGAPWVSGSTVTGLIGGFHGGGCDQEDVSYSSPFGPEIAQLLARAKAGGPADTVPAAPADGCPS